MAAPEIKCLAHFARLKRLELCGTGCNMFPCCKHVFNISVYYIYNIIICVVIFMLDMYYIIYISYIYIYIYTLYYMYI